MKQLAEGPLRKMKTRLREPVDYQMLFGNQKVAANSLIESQLRLTFLNKITCVSCGRDTNKSFNQGYCYPCFQSKAACDRCIMSPEMCHFAEGTCREPQWAQRNCNIDHFVYLANSSGLKVGITRFSQVPTRWIDQGASQALPIFKVSTRHQSGLLEVIFKEHVSDKTSWQRMLKGPADPLDMSTRRDELIASVEEKMSEFSARFGSTQVEALPRAEMVELKYPVKEYPAKVKSLSFDKTATVEGTLLGIKGQYLILDTGVINLRKFGGYHVRLEVS